MKRAPAGYILSRNMFNLIGNERHGSAWDGELEHSARSGLWSVEEYERAKVTPGRGMSGSGSGGVIFARTEENPASEAYQAERSARERYNDVHSEFIRRLEAGEVTAAVLDTWTGKIK